MRNRGVSIATATAPAWQLELKNNVHTVEELASIMALSEKEATQLEEVTASFPMNIPRYYLDLIDQNDPNDPIRKMAIPTIEEMIVEGSMGATTGDPYGDDKHDRGNGVLHKYPYTALIVATEYCSMYCRHCFRKRMVGLDTDKVAENFKQACAYVAAHPEITNVVISGGDPGLLPTSVLREMFDELRKIPHLNFVRLGTRAPVVFPQRMMEDGIIELFREFNQEKTLFLPTHFNHANELTPEAIEAISRIRSTGTAVNNQAVLLKGVNDSVGAIVDLMNGLTRAGINPYYLYQCMPVSRVRHHFQIPLKDGVDMVATARQKLDGYAKRFKFIMGHDIGKIEICGRKDDILVMQQIHARPEHPEEASRILMKRLTDSAGWLDDLLDL